MVLYIYTCTCNCFDFICSAVPHKCYWQISICYWQIYFLLLRQVNWGWQVWAFNIWLIVFFSDYVTMDQCLLETPVNAYWASINVIICSFFRNWSNSSDRRKRHRTQLWRRSSVTAVLVPEVILCSGRVVDKQEEVSRQNWSPRWSHCQSYFAWTVWKLDSFCSGHMQ